MSKPELIAGNASPYSKASLKLSCILADQSKTVATGFFAKKDDRVHLISNWHVFSGRDSFTRQTFKKNGSFPIKIEFELREGTIDSKRGSHISQSRRITVPICNDEFGLEPRWFQHPKGSCVDLAAIDVTDLIGKLEELHLPGEMDVALDMRLRPGSAVFVLGYPMGLSVQRGYPIWKRGTVASEPGYQIDDTKTFLIDTASREGMSGAPVYHMRELAAKKSDGKLVDLVVSKFVGVYSGRYGVKDEFSAQVGRVVWRSEVAALLECPSDPN